MMRLQFRFVFLLVACFLLANRPSQGQAAAAGVADDNNPSASSSDTRQIPDIQQVEPTAIALAANAAPAPLAGMTRGKENAVVPNRSAASQYNHTLATFVAGAVTKPSPGQFSYYSQKSWQSNGTGWGNSAEYRMRIRGANYGGLLFSDTPTNGTLYVSGKEPFSWPIRRYEFDVLWTRQFAPLHRRAVPYVTSGAGAIALNGGPTESGWDKQAAIVAGAGSDVRLARFVTIRVGFTVDSFKASTYGDRSYRGSQTVMVEPRIGFVWGVGAPRPQ